MPDSEVWKVNYSIYMTFWKSKTIVTETGKCIQGLGSKRNGYKGTENSIICGNRIDLCLDCGHKTAWVCQNS